MSSRVRLVDLSAAEAPLPPPPRAEAFPPVLVLCGDEDFIIDAVRAFLVALIHAVIESPSSPAPAGALLAQN